MKRHLLHCPIFRRIQVLLSILPLLGIDPLSSAYADHTKSSEASGIPLDRIGIEAEKAGAAAASTITPTSEGAHLRAAIQDLEGMATNEGLWLTSVADGDLNRPNRFRVRAAALGRDPRHVLEESGPVHLTPGAVLWTRPGLVEEYRVSSDGVRQDFVVASRPQGTPGELVVDLEVTGARARATRYGAKLTITATGRELAYSRLKVTDANGRELDARMEVEAPDRLRLIVDDSSAVYPVRIDPTFSDADWISMGGFPGTNNSVDTMIADGLGNLYIGGGFTAVGEVEADRIARWDGSEWSALGTGLDATVSALALNGTDLYAGGNFDTAGGVPANGVAKWDGSAWSALGSGVDDSVLALLFAGGQLYAGGDFTQAGGNAANCIARWNGSTWSALGTGCDDTVYALAELGGNIYAGGEFSMAGSITVNHIAVWDGNDWLDLDGGTDGAVRAIEVDGADLYAGGDFTEGGGNVVNHVALWSGGAWSDLDGGTDSRVEALLMDGGTLYVGGNFSTAGGSPAFSIATWSGTSWTSLSDGTGNAVDCLALVAGDLYIGGNFTYVDGATFREGPQANNIARWDGVEWNAVSEGFNAPVNSIAVIGDDLYVGGQFTSPTLFVARWDGSSWSDLDGGVDNTILAMAVSGGNLYVGGFPSEAGGIPVNHIAKWDGTTWSALGAGVNDTVYALAVDGSNIYAAGWFTMAGGGAASRVARWDGTAWSALGSGTNNTINALAISGTDLYAGGLFLMAGGAPANRIARWNGSAWSALGTGMDFSVETLLVSGTDLYAGGNFTTAGGNPANRIARWDGSGWSALGSGMELTVEALAELGGDLFAAGDFSTAGGNPASRIARWDGSEWSALGSGTSESVDALGVLDGELFVGGSFVFAGGKLSPYLARIIPAFPRPDVAVGPSLTRLTGRNVFLPSRQLATLTSKRARTVTGWAQIANRGSGPDILKVRGGRRNGFFALTYFAPGNVTAALLAGTHQTASLAQGQSTSVRILVKPNTGKLVKQKAGRVVVKKKTLTLPVSATALSEPTLQDAATLRVRTK